MPKLFIHHRVEDYAKWKPIFDEHRAVRKTAGCGGGRLYRSANDPNDLYISFDWDNLENARKFTESDDLQQAMQRAGVVGQPDLAFVEKIEDFTL